MQLFSFVRWPEGATPRRFSPMRRADGVRDARFTIVLVALLCVATLTVAAATSMVVRSASATTALTRR